MGHFPLVPTFTERTLQEYLVLATVFETCEFNNLNVLKFMLSKETTLVGLLSMAGRKPGRNSPSTGAVESYSGSAVLSDGTVLAKPEPDTDQVWHHVKET